MPPDDSHKLPAADLQLGRFVEPPHEARRPFAVDKSRIVLRPSAIEVVNRKFHNLSGEKGATFERVRWGCRVICYEFEKGILSTSP